MLAVLSTYLGYASQITVSYLSRCPSVPPCPACPGCPTAHPCPPCAACPACPGAPAPIVQECPAAEALRAEAPGLDAVDRGWVLLAIVLSFALGTVGSCALRAAVRFVTPRQKVSPAAVEPDVFAPARPLGVGAVRRRPALASASGVGSLAAAGAESD